MAEVNLDPGLHQIAFSQARSMTHQNACFLASESFSEGHTDILAYLVTAGVSIELYFKALMLAARNGRVTKGHDLSRLYAEFPEFIKDPIEHYYDQRVPSFSEIKVVGFIQSADEPDKPEAVRFGPGYRTVEDTVASLADVFVRSRYFFESVNYQDYAYFDFPKEPVEALSYSLARVYEHFVAGDFKGNV